MSSSAATRIRYFRTPTKRPSAPTPPLVGTTAIVQAYAYGKYLGVLDLVFDEKGVIKEATGDPILIDHTTVEDANVVARIQELAEPLKEIRQRVVGATAAVIDGNADVCRVKECAMGNLVADAIA